MEDLSKVIFEIRTRFDEVLKRKSGWGSVELKKEHDNIVIEVLSEVASKK